jgi:protein tyrosine phosphatase (PTP) superfamily phosphohydrolase (DUF442 family)
MKRWMSIVLVTTLGACANTTPTVVNAPIKAVEVAAPKLTSALADRVIRGGVHILGQPNEADFQALKAEGVRHIVNIRTETELQDLQASGFNQASVLQALGLSETRSPVGGDVGFTPAAVDALHAALQRGEPVALHCASGGRSAMVYAAYRVKYQNIEPEIALAEIPDKKLWPLSLQQLSGVPLSVLRKPQTPEFVVLEKYLSAYAKEDLKAMRALMHPDLRYYQRAGDGSWNLQARGSDAMAAQMERYFNSTELLSATAAAVSQTQSIISFQETVTWQVGDSARSSSAQATYEIRDGLIVSAWYF